MADIFISYKKERRAHAERLAAVLEAYGYEVWWDYELAVGPDFRDQIEAKLEVSKLVIVLWCSGAVKSKFVRSEASRADKREKLIQCYLEWVEPPLGFEEAQGQPLVNWTGEPDGEALAGLIDAITARLGERRRSENVVRLISGLPALPEIEPMSVIDPAETEPADGAALPDAGSGAIAALAGAASASAARWELIEKSLDPRDYDDFLEVFPSAPEAFEARRHRRQLADWAEVDHDASKTVSAFLKDPTKGADLFAALDEHARKTMRRAAEAELKAKQEQEAAERAKAEAEREWGERFGPKAARAALAAKAGNPVAERVFPVQLDDVPNWPAPNMVAIPPGRFLMGAVEGEEGATEDEVPQHEVRIDYPFALGQHSVTFAEWDAALAVGVRLEKPDDKGWGRDRRPVISVSWEDARGYLAWLNGRLGLEGRPDAYRLPSEAEWEYACRAGTETPFSFGDRINKSQAQFSRGNVGSAGQSVPVGSFPANAFGLCDMHGNVWEWCADHWHHDYNGAPLDGSIWDGGDASRRVLRGGSWFSNPRHLRSANRLRSNPTDRNGDFGFRVARTL